VRKLLPPETIKPSATMSDHDGLLGKTIKLRKELVAKDRPLKLLNGEAL
jgi:hypothetical protein